MTGALARLTRSSTAHGVAGFALMGGWAVFANRAHPMPAPLVAGLVQGALTAAITLFLKRVIEAASARLSGRARRWVPPLVAAAISAALLKTAHSLAGTPALLATISVPFTVATGYAFLYAHTLAAGGDRDG